MLREMCRNFADNELAPHAGEWDKNHTFPAEQVRKESLSAAIVTRRTQRIALSPFARHKRLWLDCDWR